MARIVGHLPVAELEARYRAAPDVTEARHFQAIWLLAQGRTVLEVSEVLAFVPRWVAQLAARDNASGQRLRPRGAGRPAAAQRQGRQPADRRGARRLGRAGAGSARGRRGVERPQGGGLDGAASRPGEGAPAARLGGAAADRLVAAGAAAAACARRGARGAGGLQGGLEAAVARAEAARIPGAPSGSGPRTSTAPA